MAISVGNSRGTIGRDVNNNASYTIPYSEYTHFPNGIRLNNMDCNTIPVTIKIDPRPETEQLVVEYIKNGAVKQITSDALLTKIVTVPVVGDPVVESINPAGQTVEESSSDFI